MSKCTHPRCAANVEGVCAHGARMVIAPTQRRPGWCEVPEPPPLRPPPAEDTAPAGREGDSP